MILLKNKNIQQSISLNHMINKKPSDKCIGRFCYIKLV